MATETIIKPTNTNTNGTSTAVHAPVTPSLPTIVQGHIDALLDAHTSDIAAFRADVARAYFEAAQDSAWAVRHGNKASFVASAAASAEKLEKMTARYDAELIKHDARIAAETAKIEASATAIAGNAAVKAAVVSKLSAADIRALLSPEQIKALLGA